MNIEEIDKWLDNEYGVSYTKLEELHDFLIEQNMKYQDKIDDLQKENKQLKETIKEATRILNSAKNHYGNDGKNWALERVINLLGE